MRAQIQTCIQDVTQIAAALDSAKRRPPREATDGLARLLVTLGRLALESDAATARLSDVDRLRVNLERTANENERLIAMLQGRQPEPEVAPEIATLQAEVLAAHAKIAKAAPPPAVRAAPAGKARREPRMPTVPEVVTMLQRVIRLKGGATIPKGKVHVPCDYPDLAKRWLTEERRERARLRELGKANPVYLDELSRRTPEALLAVLPGQDPATIGEPWPHEEEWLDRDDIYRVEKYHSPCGICGRTSGEPHQIRCRKK